MEELNKYLAKVVANSHKCAHCIYNNDGVCFFAYECIKNDWSCYDEGVEE